MALYPDNDTDLLDEILALETEQPSVQPSTTYQLDFTNGILSNVVDGEEALRQFVIKALSTARARFLIYDDDYGNELEDLIGEDVSDALLQAEIPRMVREALIYDDRIEDVRNVSVTRDSDKLYISFNVITTVGDTVEFIDQEVTI